MGEYVDMHVKLQRPTDLLILQSLDDHGRNVASNIAARIDKTRSHVNVRLPILEDYDLVDKIGPVENSGLYEINDRGRAALALQEYYDNRKSDFGDLIDEYLAGKLDKSDLENPDA